MSDWLILIGVVVFFTVALIVWGKLCVRVEHEWMMAERWWDERNTRR